MDISKREIWGTPIFVWLDGEEIRPERDVSDFIKDMPDKQCLIQRGTGGNLWVFCSEDEETASSSSHSEIRKKIKNELLRFIHYEFDHDYRFLVQFWAPVTIGGQCILTTSNQPFGVRIIDRGLCEYRKHCASYEINTDGESEEELGLIGRVFRHKIVASTPPEVRAYSTKHYPQRDTAVNCGIHGSVAVPIFEPSAQSCVGVLELVYTRPQRLDDDKRSKAFLILQAIKSSCQFSRQVKDEIWEKLKKVCIEHNLPFAQSWIPCSVVAYGDSQEKSFSYSDLICTTVFPTDWVLRPYLLCEMFEFNEACRYHNCRKGQGLVGKALLSHKPFFCRDITQLPINGYPLGLANSARKCGLTGCFAICLRDCTSNQDYVLEFFLPPSTDYGDSINIDTKVPQDFLDKLLATIMKYFQGFKIASGKELGEELSVEEVNFDRVEEICQITRLPLLPESGETFQLLDEQLTVETVGKNGDSQKKRKHKATGSSFRLEDIQQCFGMKLEDAAERLRVSRSTLKRVCREQHGIERWPNPKRKKVNNSSNLKQSNEFVQCGNEQNPDATPIQDVRTVTVKAIYGDDIFKFQLPFSSKMTDLVEKLNIRLRLKDVPLSIKYEDKEGDWVSIACDEDLEECIGRSRSLLDKTILEILVKPITIQAP